MLSPQSELNLSYVIGRSWANGSVVATSQILAQAKAFYAKLSGAVLKCNWISGDYSSSGRNIVEAEGVDIVENPAIYEGNGASASDFYDALSRMTRNSAVVILSDAFFYEEADTAFQEAAIAFLNEVSRNRVAAVFFHDVPGAMISSPSDQNQKTNVFDALDPGVNILATTSFLAEDIREQGDLDAVHLFPPLFSAYGLGETLPFLDPAKEEINRQTRQRLNIADDDLLFLQATRVSPNKGIARAIKLAKKAEQMSGKVCWLVVTGECNTDYKIEHRRELESLAASIGYEHLMFLDGAESRGLSISQLYMSADAAMFLSTNEGFGLPVADALAHGIPVVTSKYRDYAGKHSVYEQVYHERGAQVLVEEDPFSTEISDSTARNLLDLIENPDLIETMRNGNSRAIKYIASLNAQDFKRTMLNLFVEYFRLKLQNPELLPTRIFKIPRPDFTDEAFRGAWNPQLLWDLFDLIHTKGIGLGHIFNLERRFAHGDLASVATEIERLKGQRGKVDVVGFDNLAELSDAYDEMSAVGNARLRRLLEMYP